MNRRHDIVLRLFLKVPELAVGSLAAAFEKVLADGKLGLFAVGSEFGQDVWRQLAGRAEVLLLALGAVEELAARPGARAILKVVAEGVLVRVVVVRALVQVFATLATVAHVAKEVPAHATRRGLATCVASARHRAQLGLSFAIQLAAFSHRSVEI